MPAKKFKFNGTEWDHAQIGAHVYKLNFLQRRQDDSESIPDARQLKFKTIAPGPSATHYYVENCNNITGIWTKKKRENK